ncbi:2-hydroxyacyl-CoA lyase 2 isoform X2 [Petaurus breviceps papuanus]|uniref:2-hydroxyacyl-CoA lyase 2 isoform X2 n=1 Tax=Petaurus breviceps papuanus TaxID=3040969 RepID=UPI0036D798D2
MEAGWASVPCCVLLACGALGAVLLGVAHRLGLFYQLLHQVDKSSSRHGGESVAAVLRAHGVRFIFTLVGGHISPLLVAAEKVGIRVVDTRQEATAVFAADAVARLSGTVGVAAVTAGPGLTNTVTAVKNAQMAQSPVLLLGGAASTLLQGRGPLQGIDQMSLFRPLCKFCASVRRVRDIIPTLRAAFAAAQSGTPGPVFVELPIDVLYPYFLVQKEVMPSKASKSLMGKLVSWYLQNHLANLFAGAWEPQPEGPLPVNIPQASSQQVQRCVELVSRAKKPLLLLGSQALLPPTPAESLRAAVESLGIPCFLGGMARGLLGRDSPLHIRQNRRDALKEADVVVLAGTVCDFRLSYGRVLSHRSKIIAVNRDREQLLLNSDLFWKPQEAVQGEQGPLCWLDPGAFGTLGVGGGFALGAKLCRPDAEVWVLFGDGALGYSIIEFDTFVRHKIPVIAVVGNDACWTQISREQVPMLGSNVACGLVYTDYHVVAEGLGSQGFLLSRDNENKAAEVLHTAQLRCHEGRPVLINVLIGRSDFRDGSISV